MPVINDAHFLCTLPSGNKAVYAVTPQHLNDRPGTTLNERAIMYGTPVAHEFKGQWFKPGGWDEITDTRTIALLERCPEA